jgi:trehalose synthase
VLRTVPVSDIRRVDDYREAAGDEAVDRLRKAAAPLKGSRLVHLSSTSFGGGVAELLHTQVPLLQDLGIDAQWRLLEGSDEFFAVTKLIHNGLQGGGEPWSAAMEQTYLERVASNAERWEDDADFVFVHDPQPLALLTFVDERAPHNGRWIWRCHIEVTHPMEAIWAFLEPHARRFDATVVTLEEYTLPEMPAVSVIAPSIDPLSPKNTSLDPEAVLEIMSAYGVDTERPIVTQISRFDPWKDPVGVIEAFRLARERRADMQLILAGSMAHDDPEAWHLLELTQEQRADDSDIHILTNLQEVGPVAINAFQRASDVVIQKSIREGFGLTASEAMWKERAMIVGNVGGLRIQVEDGVSGYLVDSVEECADRILDLVGQPELRASMGRAGRDRVRDRFLTVRELTDYLDLVGSL